MTRESTPGLLKRPRPNGTVEYRWSAVRAVRRNAKVKAFRPLTVLLEQDTHEARVERCFELTAELKEWLHAQETGRPRRGAFDGTIRSLNRIYETHPDSPFNGTEHATRRVYSAEAKVLIEAVGSRRLDRITGADLRRWHAQFAKPLTESGELRLRRAQGAMKALRRIASWGVQMRLPGCVELRDILREARFAMPKARESAPTYGQIVAFIQAAHAMGRPSLALTAALMFDTSLRQTDIIGKWEPVEDARDQGIFVHKGRRWSGGVLWEDIRDGVLTKRTTKTGAVGRWALADLPHVTAEIERLPEERRIGPMVVDERTGRPYRHRWFAAIWRKVAREAGIPDHVWSRDTRAGAITEAFDAGAELEQVRQMATHSDPKVTGRYNRGSTKQTSNVARLRLRHREQKTE